MKLTSDYKKSKTCGVYRIRNISNNKSYIGSSKGIEYRLYEHHKNLNKNKHNNQYLQNAWNKYGKDNFVFEIIEECNEDFLIELEQKLINESKSSDRQFGYNICEIADRPFMTQEVRDKISNTLKGNIPWNLGVPHTEESKEKMSQSKLEWLKTHNHSFLGKTHTEESKEKIRQANLKWVLEHGATRKGKTHTEESKEKMSNKRKGKSSSNKGIPLSEETKKKISDMNKGRKNESQCKKVNQLIGEKIVNTFCSISEARRSTGISHIDSCANGKRKSAGGFTWKFVDIE